MTQKEDYNRTSVQENKESGGTFGIAWRSLSVLRSTPAAWACGWHRGRSSPSPLTRVSRRCCQPWTHKGEVTSRKVLVGGKGGKGFTQRLLGHHPRPFQCGFYQKCKNYTEHTHIHSHTCVPTHTNIMVEWVKVNLLS